MEKYTKIFNRTDMMTNYVPVTAVKKHSKKYLKAKNNGYYTLCFKNANKDFLTMVAG